MRNALLSTPAATVLLLCVSVVFTVQAGEIRQITDDKAVSFDWPMLDGSGSEVLLITSSNQLGGNPDHNYMVISFDPATGVGTALTSFGQAMAHTRHNLSITDDGQWLAFIATGDLIPGQNGNRNAELFVMMRDGSQLAQLTDDASANAGEVIRIAMAGSGNRIAFASSSDLTGGNPNNIPQVFVVDLDGSNLTQMTGATEGEIQHMWISDDGTRIVWSHNGDLTGGNPEKNYEIFSMAVGDASPRQVTSSVSGDSKAANISGDGNTIVFHSNANFTGGNADGGLEIFKTDWATATIVQVTNSLGPFINRESRQAWPTDDGSQLFFASNQSPAIGTAFEAFRINADGTGLTQLTSAGVEVEHPVVSGDGSQLAFWRDDGLFTVTASGTGLVELVDRTVPLQGYPDISTDGQWMVIESDADYLGTNADGSLEVWSVKSDGSQLTQLTFAPSGFTGRPAIDGLGARIYFESSSDFTGGNPDLNNEVFGVDRDGTNMIQYSDCDPGDPNVEFSGYAEASDDGNTIVFTSLCDLTGGNADHTGELFRIDPDGQNLTQITSFPSVQDLVTYVYWPRLDASGTWVVFSGNANLAGGNPDNGFEVWRMMTDGTNLDQITNSATLNSFFPDISGDGTRIVFRSATDPLGTNADNNNEIFLYEPAAATPLRQLTQTTVGTSTRARLSRDGAYVFFLSNAPLLGSDPNVGGRQFLYRYEIATDTITRAGGLGLEQTLGGYWPAVDDDGSIVAYASFGDVTGDNPDDYWEVLVADYTASNPPVVSAGPAPTTITFEPEPGPIRYDVIRGDVADLADGGGTVDLGPVVCIEDNSGDTTTEGYEDTVTPAPGQAFYYVFRGTMGGTGGPGSYGAGSNGDERVAGLGDCDG